MYTKISKGIVKKTERREVGIFIDGIALDRAARRLNKKIDMTAFVQSLACGAPVATARYYTIIPNEDDSRQRSFLDAVHRAGLQVIVKRLPPKGITKQVSIDVEMSADIIAFAMGHTNFGTLSQYTKPRTYDSETPALATSSEKKEDSDKNIKRVITVVCPSRDLSYPISLANELKIETVTADFGSFNTGDILKSATKWVDLSDAKNIWRE